MAGKQIGVTLKFIDDFTQGFNASIRALTEGTKNAQKLSKQITKVGSDITNVGKTLTASVTLPIVALGTKAYMTAKSVDDSMASVMTLQDKMTDTYDEAKKAISNYSVEFGKDFSEIADSYYTLTSAFNDTSQVSKGLKTVMQLSTAGKVSADEAAKAVAVAYNAYGGDIQKIGDIIAATNAFGFTTIGELGDSMASVTPTAQQLGMSIEDLYTSMAVITSTGVSTSEAVTYLKNALNSITKEGDRAKIANGGFLNYLKDLKKEVPTVEAQMKKFTNIRARSGITALLGNLDLYDEYAKKMGDCNGMLQSMSDKMQDTSSFKWAQTIQRLNQLLLKFGDKIAPIVNKALDKFNNFIEGINLTDGQVEGILKVAAGLAAIGPALMGIGSVIKVIGTGLKIFNAIKGAVIAIKGAGIAAALASPLGIVLLVIGAILMLVIIIRKNFDRIKPAIDRLGQAFQPLMPHLQKIGQAIMAIGQIIFEVFSAKVTYVIVQTISLVTNLINVITTTVMELADSIQSIFGGVLTVLQGLFTLNFEQIGQGLVQIFEGVANLIGTILKTPIRIVVAAINAIISGINSIKVKVPDWVPGIGGKGWEGFNIPTIPDFAEGVENFRGGLAHINEEGGEIVDLPQGSRVIPHDVSMAMAKTGQNITISLAKLADSIVIREEGDIDKFTSMFSEKLVRAYINS